MSMGELHEHGSTVCEYEGVNGANLRFVDESLALASSLSAFEALRPQLHRLFSRFPSA
jgi:hypothetical protein